MDAYIGEIRAVGFNFAPRNWAFCAGQLMSISQNTALFSILGTTYGGDGRSTFALPNLSGQAVVNAGQGPGLANYSLGEVTGTENETLLLNELPMHAHAVSGQFLTQEAEAGLADPTNNYLATTLDYRYSEGAGGGTMAADMLKGTAGPTGGNQPHGNMMPYLGINYIICLVGEWPVRS
jgi:microcystin-dependent protein